MPEQQNPKQPERVPERQRERSELGSTKWRFRFAGNKGAAGRGTYNLEITSVERADPRIFRMIESNASGNLVGGFRGETRGRFESPAMNAIDFQGATSRLEIEKRGVFLNGSLSLSVPSKRFAIAVSLETFTDQSVVRGALTSGDLVVSGQILL